MKRRMLARITVAKAKRTRKRGRHHAAPRARDPKDLRGAKGVLLESAAEAVLPDQLAEAQGADQRHPPIRIQSDW